MNQLFEILEEVQNTSMECVLATIIQVKGSAYLREGTSMLIKKDGTFTGIISAGCLETDLLHHSQRIFESKKAETIVYNMENNEDLDWGVSTGCNGILYILLEYVDHKLKENLLCINDTITKGKDSIYQRVLSNEWNLSESYFSPEDSFKDESLRYSQTSNYVFTQKFSPKPRLIIFGAGADAHPVVSLASQTGFSVTVCDWRESLCNEHNIPEADKYIIGFPKEIEKQISFKKDDYVIMMTHNFQRDKEILSFVKDESLFYLGILGSRKRTASLFDDEIPKNIHAPIGLSIGAVGPYEIAVSIIAELIHIKTRKTGQ
ncbi:XdhC family protein [Peribacillus sp. NPDC097284]|uniref:XdhC family protein n=1 Tax=Peribacillus sp. NPDC097284 TaxID=3364401 RepID=UPI00381974C4